MKRLFTKTAVVALAVAILGMLWQQQGEAKNPFSIPAGTAPLPNGGIVAPVQPIAPPSINGNTVGTTIGVPGGNPHLPSNPVLGFGPYNVGPYAPINVPLTALFFPTTFGIPGFPGLPNALGVPINGPLTTSVFIGPFAGIMNVEAVKGLGGGGGGMAGYYGGY